MKNFKHLVTSGCSFSQSNEHRWPAFLSKELDLDLYNRGQSGASNGWISRSIIYQSELLFGNGIDPSSILVVVMWSGFDRMSLYSKKPTEDTIDFFNQPENIRYDKLKPGFLEGTIDVYDHFEGNDFFLLNKYFPPIFRALLSYENILRLQWYCETKNLRLVNLAYCDIFKYPEYRFTDKVKTGPTTEKHFARLKHLHKLINFDNWMFYNGSGGMFEYVANEGLPFEEDNHHPRSEAHQIYVKKFLVPQLKEKGII
jgi:hypothetical protein